MMEPVYRRCVDPQLELLMERIYPPRVCIDNDTFEECTLVKVDSANKHGILLEMVQVLTDLDLVISKSYISSDGGWFMDVFHVTDQLGNKLTDESLIHYIQQALCASRRSEGFQKMTARTCMGRELLPRHLSTEHTTLEITATDRPGLLSEISAVLLDLGCNITAAKAWTHHRRAASIIYIEEGWKEGPIRDPQRLAHVQEQLENVVHAHNGRGETSSVRLTAPMAGRTHTERRLHQLMYANGDYEQCHCCDGGDGYRTKVGIESCKEKGYSVIDIKSRDRPKLLFDTVCALTDLQYVVFHASVSSEGTMAHQEYFIRHKGGCILDSESERNKLSRALVAAIERRVSHGLRLELCTQNRMGLLSDITRVFRENGLSISRIEVGTNGERAVGSFYVTDSSGCDVNPRTIELMTKEIGGSVVVVQEPSKSAALASRQNQGPKTTTVEEKPRFSLGSLLWSQLERLSSNFGPYKIMRAS